MSNSSNDKTLQTYEQNFSRYIGGTVQVNKEGDFQTQWLHDFLQYLPKDARILEIGSAFGRDAQFIEELGYSVLRTDAFNAAVKYLRGRGHKAERLNALTDNIPQGYDALLANAVFLHFTKGEFAMVLRKCYDALTEDGILAFSLKKGDGEVMSDEKMEAPRYFRYWQTEPVIHLLGQAQFEALDQRTSPDDKWLNFLARKR